MAWRDITLRREPFFPGSAKYLWNQSPPGWYFVAELSRCPAVAFGPFANPEEALEQGQPKAACLQVEMDTIEGKREEVIRALRAI